MKKHHRISVLIWYYALLQSLHLFILARAGILMLSGQDAPFPILPPPGGWEAQTLPFMFGLGGMDVVAIILALIFAYQSLFKGKMIRRMGILSLTIAFTGAIVFAVGTFPSGAWAAHLVAYWIMVVLFIPAGWLLIRLLKGDSMPAHNKEKK
ncbi:MAG: hypothetical protein U9R53_06870 [Chloroflexota bacterium]|nr:hypothetical protein [Chloroflexota bacterium]